MDAVPGQACQLGHGGEVHLLGHGQHQRLKQQGETGELGEPIGLDQDNLHVRQRDAWRSYFQEAFVLEEIKMLRALDLGVVHGIKGADARDGKRGPATKSTPIVSIFLLASKSTPLTHHGLAIPRVASKSWFCLCPYLVEPLAEPSMARRLHRLRYALQAALVPANKYCRRV